MKDAHLQHAVEYAAFRLFLRWLQPASARSRGGARAARLGRLARRLLASKRRLAEQNVASVFPELSEDENATPRRALLRAFRRLLSGGGVGRAPEARRTSAPIRCRGIRASRRRAVGFARGCFLTTGHYRSLGTGDVPRRRLGGTSRTDSFHAVARPLDNPKIDADLRASRERYGVEIIDKAGAAHRMLNAYRRGGLVAVVIDQHVRESAGVQVPFFGRPAWTSPVLATLSLRTGAPVVPFTCVPAEPGRYRLTIHEAIEPLDRQDERAVGWPRPKCRDDASVSGGRRVQTFGRQPEYWLWMHRRWR